MSPLRNFDTDLDVQGVQHLPSPTQVRTSPSIVSESVTAVRSVAKAYVAKADENWTWSDLRDYVVGEIERRFGVFPRDVRKEAGIFKSYLTRYPNAAAITRYAFEVADGYWAGAPVSVNRWCRGSDPYFSDPIAKRLAENEGNVTGW